MTPDKIHGGWGYDTLAYHGSGTLVIENLDTLGVESVIMLSGTQSQRPE